MADGQPKTRVLSDFLHVLKSPEGAAPPAPAGTPGVGPLSAQGMIQFLQKVKAPSRLKGREALPEDLQEFANLEAGAPFKTRSVLSFKRDNKEKISALVEMHGKDNVSVDKDTGRLFIDQWNVVSPAKFKELKEKGLSSDRMEKTKRAFKVKQPTAVDPDTFMDVGEVTDFVADALEMGVSLAAPAIGGAIGSLAGPAGAAAGVAAGKALQDPFANIVKQGVGALLPGEEDRSLAERAAEVGVALVGSKVGDVLTNAGSRAFDASRPTNIIRKAVRGDLDPTVIAEGKDLEKLTGISLTLDQLTKDPATTLVRGLIEQKFGGGKIRKRKVQQLMEFSELLDKRLNDLADGRGVAEIGEKVSRLTKLELDALAGLRRERLTEKFSKAAALTGNKRVIPLKNTVKEWLAQAEEFGFTVDLGGARVIEKRAQENFDKVMNLAIDESRKAGKTNLSDDELLEFAAIGPLEASRMLTFLGKAKKGTSKVILGLEDKTENQAVAARLIVALNKDLDAISAKEGVSSEAVKLIREGRREWGDISNTMNDIRQSILGKSLGFDANYTPEKFVDKVLDSWTPTESKAGLKILEKIDPVALDEVRRTSIERILSDVTVEDLISPRKLSRLNPRRKERLESLLEGDKALKRDWDTAVAMAGRLAHGSGIGSAGSQTFGLQMANQIIENLFEAGVPSKKLAVIKSVLTARRTANAFVNVDERDAILTLLKTKESTKNIIKAANRLGLMQVREDITQATSGTIQDPTVLSGFSPSLIR